MKRTTNYVLPVDIEFNLDLVKSIKFKFVQTGKTLVFTYPTFNAFRESDDKNTVLIRFTAAQTSMFNTEQDVAMDTLIKLKESDENPETNIVKFKMNPTLFTLEEVTADA